MSPVTHVSLPWLFGTLCPGVTPGGRDCNSVLVPVSMTIQYTVLKTFYLETMIDEK